MAKINLTPKNIFEQEFKTSMRGYDKKEVDEFLDDIIKDYETYITLVKELQEENAKLKSQARQGTASRSTSQPAYAGVETVRSSAAVASASNYDILKRISRLEKEVFGKQITE